MIKDQGAYYQLPYREGPGTSDRAESGRYAARILRTSGSDFGRWAIF